MKAKILNKRWGVDAKHALFHKDGTWFNNLKRFPGALFDSNGYVIFDTLHDYLNCEAVRVTQQTNVTDGISKLPQYRRIQSGT